jgi:hypothetical protein
MDFNGLKAIFRPLRTWPGPATKGRRASPFRAAWPDTLSLLQSEINHLQPRRVVVEMDLQEHQIRNDGYPKANARAGSPGVIVSVELRGATWLRWPCDTFTDWQDNIRAIALTLEKLRAIDRYGVTKRSEQYAGWKALPPGGATIVAASPHAAAQTLLSLAGDGRDPSALTSSWDVVSEVFRAAAKRTHPDAGGSSDDYTRATEARAVLARHHRREG